MAYLTLNTLLELDIARLIHKDANYNVHINAQTPYHSEDTLSVTLIATSVEAIYGVLGEDENLEPEDIINILRDVEVVDGEYVDAIIKIEEF
jgi:hypothetical protein